MSTRAVIVDIDGTVALMGKGQPGRRGPFEWQRVGEDDPNEPVIQLVRIFRAAGYRIIFVSGRDEECRDQTERWLVANGAIPVGDFGAELWMRAHKDNRPDEIVKREIYEHHIKPRHEVAYVVDDRNKVVAMWRSLGLTVLQCADGDF